MIMLRSEPHKRSWTNWKFGDFVLQLATVVIGILITFGGSALIQKGVERRQARHLLEMVAGELKGNIFLLKSQRDYLIGEFAAARALLPYIHDPLSAPPDTIVKYQYVANLITFNRVLTPALEVMKNSPQVDAVGDAELLRSIFNMYTNIEVYYGNLWTSFVESKADGIHAYYDNMPLSVAEATYRGDEQAWVIVFADMMQRSAVLRNYLISMIGGRGEGFIPHADSLIADVEEVIARIDAQTGK